MGIFDWFKGKKENSNDLELRVSWEEIEDVGIVSHYKGTPFTGICYSLYDNGNMKNEQQMMNGLKHGTSKNYTKDGKLHYKQKFINDKISGLTELYKYSEEEECTIIKLTEKEWTEYNVNQLTNYIKSDKFLQDIEYGKLNKEIEEEKSENDNSNKTEQKEPVQQMNVFWDKLIENTRKKDKEKKSIKYKTLKDKHKIDFDVIEFCSLTKLKDLEKNREYNFIMCMEVSHYSGCYQLEKSDLNKNNQTLNEWNDEYDYGTQDGDFDKTNEIFCSSPEIGYTVNTDKGSSGFGYLEISQISSKDFIKTLNIKLEEYIKDTGEEIVTLYELMIWLNGGEEDYEEGMCLFNLLQIKNVKYTCESIDSKNHVISWSSTESYLDSGDREYRIGYIDKERPQRLKKDNQKNKNYLEKFNDSILRVNKENLNITFNLESGEIDSTYNNTLFTGIYYELYENGQVKIECEYKNGKINGLTKEWYENGQLKRQLIQQEKEPYERNKKCWDEDGNEIECKEE